MSRFLDKNKGTLANALANLIDTYAADDKGKLFTLAIAASGYTNDIKGLQDFYEANEKVINTYFSYIDLQALSDAVGGNLEKEIVNKTAGWVKARIPAFVAGAGIFAGLILIKRRWN